MKLLRCGLVGGLCGLVGAGLWAAIAHFANVEIGWSVWGVGGLVGLGVLKAADGRNGLDTGFLAVVIAVVSILGGKYAASHLAVSQIFDKVDAKAPSVTDESMISDLATEVVEEYQAKKKRLAWPQGVDPEEAFEKKDFPRDVWAEAENRWKAKPEAERTSLKAERAAEMTKLMGALGDHLRDEGFKRSFSPMDVLFFGLAIVTAFKFGAGVHGGD